MQKSRAKLLENTRVAQDIHALRLQTETGVDVGIGQFAQVTVAAPHTLLPRPISICNYDAHTGVLTLIIQKIGTGTAALCGLEAGCEVELLWPLGNGFSILPQYKSLWLAGGGVGVAPLLYAARQAHAAGLSVEVFAGFRNHETAYLQAELGAYAKVWVTSDDGSVGQKGYVHEALGARLAQAQHGTLLVPTPPDALLVCGPPRMMKAMQGLMLQYPKIPAFASAEARMACGFGVCRVCVCSTKSGGYPRVCADGPVFALGEVVL